MRQLEAFGPKRIFTATRIAVTAFTSSFIRRHRARHHDYANSNLRDLIRGEVPPTVGELKVTRAGSVGLCGISCILRIYILVGAIGDFPMIFRID